MWRVGRNNMRIIHAMRHDEFLDDNEYPDDKDIDEFGHDSPLDYDPLTIGYIGDSRPPFWTRKRVILLIGGLVLIGALLLPFLFRLL
jgi:hypothetical protein